ncbi:MAG: TolC family protein [Archangium sp.]|nr:TolC family protein [Archangium sp.]
MRAVVFIGLVMSTAAVAAPMTLPELVARARANDHRVREAQAQLRWFKSKYEEAKWAWFPRLDSYAAIAGPTPEAKNDALGGPPTTPASLMYDLDFGQPGVMLRAGAEAVLPIYTFGKLNALERAGKKGVEAGAALTSRAEDEAELQVKQAYWAYCMAKAGRAVLLETSQRLEEASVTLTRLLAEESDQVTQIDAYKLDYYRQQLEVQLASADAGASFALAAIRLLIAAPPKEVIELVVVDFQPPVGELSSVDDYVELARTSRPEIRAIEAGIGAREQEVIIRERMYLPDFGIAGFARWMWTTSATRQRSPFAYDPYNDLSAGLALVMKYTFDFPQKGAALEQSRAELEKMTHQRDLLVGGVQLELEKVVADLSAAMIRADRQAKAERSARRWATSAFTGFDIGTGTTRELIDAFTAFAAAASAKVQAQHDATVGLAQLSRAVGRDVQLQTVREPPTAPPPASLTPK